MAWSCLLDPFNNWAILNMVLRWGKASFDNRSYLPAGTGISPILEIEEELSSAS